MREARWNESIKLVLSLYREQVSRENREHSVSLLKIGYMKVFNMDSWHKKKVG